MKQIIHKQRIDINIELLHQELETGLGRGRFFSISTHPQEGVIFQVADDVQPEELDTIINAHDPSKKTVREQREAEIKQKREWLKTTFDPVELRQLIETRGKDPVLLELLDAVEALTNIIRG